MESIRDKSGLDRLLRARAALITGAPFYGCLALSMRLVEAPHVETMAVDGVSLFYAPAFVAELSEPELIGVLAHEVSHIAYLHHVRRGGRDPENWNAAADYAVNRDVLAAGFVLPKSRLLDPRFDGMGAEEIYTAIHSGKSGQQQPEQDEGEESPAGAAGDGKSGQEGDAGDDDSGDDGAAAGEAADGDGPGDASQGNGQGGGGQPAADPARCGGVLDAACDVPGLKEAAAKAEATVRQAIGVAASQAGELPGHLKRLLGELNKPRVSWRDVLARFIDDAATRALDWNRPNKRFLDSGLLPAGHDSR